MLLGTPLADSGAEGPGSMSRETSSSTSATDACALVTRRGLRRSMVGARSRPSGPGHTRRLVGALITVVLGALFAQSTLPADASAQIAPLNCPIGTIYQIQRASSGSTTGRLNAVDVSAMTNGTTAPVTATEVAQPDSGDESGCERARDQRRGPSRVGTCAPGARRDREHPDLHGQEVRPGHRYVDVAHGGHRHHRQAAGGSDRGRHQVPGHRRRCRRSAQRQLLLGVPRQRPRQQNGRFRVQHHDEPADRCGRQLHPAPGDPGERRFQRRHRVRRRRQPVRRQQHRDERGRRSHPRPAADDPGNPHAGL